MFQFSSSRSANPASRREFLKSGAVSLGGLALPGLLASKTFGSMAFSAQSKSVIFIYLAGGPSHLDMYDMKPDAPAEIRGDFRPISSNVLGIRVCEHLPLHAKIAEKFAIVNGVETADSHDASVTAPGSQRAAGCRLDVMKSPGSGTAPGLLESGGSRNVAMPHGDWDTHGRVLRRRLSIFDELRDKLPAYDALVHNLITDIYKRGQDRDVLVIACGEFGRTPWINEHGGRNHWAPCGSVLFAGGGLRMGQVIGNTGPIGEREQSRTQPYTAGNIHAMIYRHLGVDPATLPQSVQPIAELI